MFKNSLLDILIFLLKRFEAELIKLAILVVSAFSIISKHTNINFLKMFFAFQFQILARALIFLNPENEKYLNPESK